MFKARDIMTTHVVAVSEDDTVDYAISLMVKHRISGLPVLDHYGCPTGVVSEYDLMELACEGTADAELVRDYASAGLFGVNEDDSWVTVADMLRDRHVRRLPVLRDGRLVGIVSRHDLIHAIRDARQHLRQQLKLPRGEAADLGEWSHPAASAPSQDGN